MLTRSEGEQGAMEVKYVYGQLELANTPLIVMLMLFPKKTVSKAWESSLMKFKSITILALV